MKHKPSIKMPAVFAALILLVLCCAVSAFAIPSCDHQHTAWIIETPATCTQPGLRHQVCTDCNATLASEVIDPLGHQSQAYEDWLSSTNDAEYYIGWKNVAYSAPTCTEQGSIKFNCDVCGEPVRIFELEATGHTNAAYDKYLNNQDDLKNYVGEANVAYQPASCTETGNVTFCCEVCQAKIASFELEATGHTNAALEAWDYCFLTDPDFGTDEDLKQYVSWNNVDYTSETCTEPGVVTFKCADCQAVIRTMTVVATGHSSAAYDDYTSNADDPANYAGKANVVYKPSNCTETGSVTFRCDTCQAEIATFELDPLGHDDGVWTIDFEPTAAHDGQMTRYCSRCGDALESKEFTVLHTHTFGYETVAREATCTTAGELGKVCASCGNVYETTVIDPLGHDYGDWYKNNDGTHTRGCSRCGFDDTQNCIYNKTVIAPTCLKGGKTINECAVCAYTFEDKFTDALGHDWSDWTDDGNGESHSRTCSRCSEKETEAHAFSDYEVKLGLPGERFRTCAVCGCVESQKLTCKYIAVNSFTSLVRWVAEVVRKVIYIVSLQWFIPSLNLSPKL